MPKFRIAGTEIISFVVEVEAEDKEHAEHLAFEEGYLWDHGKVMHNEIEDVEISEIKE